MSGMTDDLRSGLAALADEVRVEDLRDRALRTSRRLAVRWRVLTAAAAGGAVGLLMTTVALALPVQDETPPAQPAVTGQEPPPANPSQPALTTPASPSRPALTTPAPPAAIASPNPPVEPLEPPDDPVVPAEAMLQVADVGSGYRTDDQAVQHHGSMSMLMAYCGHVIDEDPLRSRLRGFRSDDDDTYLHQEVYRYGQDGAERVMDGLRNALPACRRVEVGGSTNHVSELTLVRSDFTGAESLLVAETYTTPDETVNRYHVIVREADLYAQVLLEAASEQRAVAIATAVAGRLCEGTAAC
jgi:hypothetical protein